MLQDLVDGHLVALAVRVHLSRHLVREQVELAPGELDVGKGENTGESTADIDLRVGQSPGLEGGLRHRRINLIIISSWTETETLKDVNKYQHVRIGHLLGHQTRDFAVISAFRIK